VVKILALRQRPAAHGFSRRASALQVASKRSCRLIREQPSIMSAMNFPGASSWHPENKHCLTMVYHS
jgi:hypothetical protein